MMQYEIDGAVLKFTNTCTFLQQRLFFHCIARMSADTK